MNKSEFILSVFSLTPEVEFSPVQVQKLFFLIDRKLGLNLFNFQPYLYGPFDKEICTIIDNLVFNEKKLEELDMNGIKQWRIGNNRGVNTDTFLDTGKRKYIKELIHFIKGQSFKGLLESIYSEYPEMAKNSILYSNKA